MKKNVFDIEIKIDGDVWSKALDTAFKEKVKDAKIDGFRKGKCPRNIYEKKVGVETLYNIAVDTVLDVAYTKALSKDNLVPIIEPKIDIKEIDKEKVIFTFKITTKPEVKIKKYKNLGIKKDEVKVSKKEVDEEIDKILDKYSDLVIKEDKSEKGDTVIIDFEGFANGKAFDGGKGENYSLTLGSNTFIPGFEDQLIGKKAGEEVDVKVTFPKDYASEELKGKDAVFKVKVHEVKTKQKPEIDKDLFLDLGFDVKDEKEFRDLIKDQIKVKKEEEANIKFENELLEEIEKNTEVELEEEIINNELHHMIHHYEENLKMQGIDLQMFYQFTNSNEEALKDQMRPEAIKRIKYRFILEEIVNLEKIEVKDAEIDEKIEEITKKYNITKEEFLKEYGGIENFKYELQMTKAIDLIKA